LKPSVLISVALLMGALAVFLVARWVGVGGGAPVGPRVVVMASAIEGGMPLMANHVRTLNWPDRIAPPGAFEATDKVIGRVVRQAMVPGEPVLESRLSPVDVKGGLSATLAPGKRAITVRVNDVIGVAGFALPGSWVDVLVSARDTRNEPFSKIVLERVRVLAVAQETASDPAKPKVVSAVTLELTPEESERLDLARSVGSLSLALRNELDRDLPVSSGTRLEDLVQASGAASSRATGNAGKNTTRSPAAHSGTSATGVEELRGTQRSTGGAP
jgi:pilus assembly protein CpaB